MIGQFFDICTCYPNSHADSIQVVEDWHEDTVHGLETRVSLVWHTGTERFDCLDNYYPNGLHGASYEQLVILLHTQRWKQTFENHLGVQTAFSGIIEHQSTAISQAGFNFDLASDDVLKNVIAVLEFDEPLGIWHSEVETSLGGEILANGWIFEFHPDFGLRYYMGSLGSPSGDISTVYISPEQNNIVLGRFQLDANCNVIGEQAGVSLPQFMRNRPKEYLLVLPSDITFTGNYEGTEYTDHVVLAAGEYPFYHRCTAHNDDCTSAPSGFQFIFGDCLCEPYKFDAGIHHYYPSQTCNDTSVLTVSTGTIRFGESDFLSLYVATHQGWTGGVAYADWKIKTGTNIDYYSDSTIEPKTGEVSAFLTVPSQAIVRFNGFGL